MKTISFTIGDGVRLKADPDEVGTVVSIKQEGLIRVRFLSSPERWVAQEELELL